MLYLESPAGSFISPLNMKSGFSYCLKKGVRQASCSWNDVSQAEAHGHTLRDKPNPNPNPIPNWRLTATLSVPFSLLIQS